MIKSLRRRFMLINLALVLTVLIVVLSVILLDSVKRIDRESDLSLRHAMSVPNIATDDFRIEVGDKVGNKIMNIDPVFTIELSETGNKISKAQNVEISEETIDKAIDSVNKADATTGIIWSLNLKYLRSGNKIAFIELSRDIGQIKNMLFTTGILLLGSGIAFIGISFLLAYLATRPIEKTWRDQKQFIADASHELKTPLTVMLANTDILLSHTDESIESQRRWVDSTAEEGARMRKLIDDLLFLARSDATGKSASKSYVNISELAQSAALTLEAIAYERGLQIDTDIEKNVTLDGCAEDLSRLITILLDNAIKYSDGSHNITFILRRTGTDGVRMSVTSFGMLIPKDDLENVFSRFYRTDSSRVRSSGGYGLGLAIARSIVLEHQGHIYAQSDERSGTVFFVELRRHE